MAYQSFMKSWDTIKEKLAEEILDYYEDLRYELGYEEIEDENYPEIETTDEIIQRVQLTGIVVSYAGIHEGREIGLTFACSWNKENGIGVRLLNEEIDEIGYSHVAL